MKTRSMNNLEANKEHWLDGYRPVILKPGQLIQGEIVPATGPKGSVLVNYGGKMEGIVIDSPANGVQAGDRMMFFVQSVPPDDDHPVKLSMDQADHWKSMQDAQASGRTITVVVKRVATTHDGRMSGVRVIADNGLTGFIPRSLLTDQVKNASSPIGIELPVKVISARCEQRELVFDNVKAVTEWTEMIQESIFSSLKRGDIIEGTITAIGRKKGTESSQSKDFGLFVDIGHGLYGMVHRSEIPRAPAQLSTLFKPGDQYKFMVLGTQRDAIRRRPRISLSIKRLEALVTKS
jgi:ribosomal protein S1